MDFRYHLSPFSAENKQIYRLSKRTWVIPFTLVNTRSSAAGESHETGRKHEKQLSKWAIVLYILTDASREQLWNSRVVFESSFTVSWKEHLLLFEITNKL